MKIKELFNRVKKLLTKLCAQFSVSLTLIFITTLFLAIFLGRNILTPSKLKNIFLFLSLLTTGTFFTESYFKIKSIRKTISYLIFLIISTLLVILNNINLGLNKEIIYRIISVYYIVISISSVYQLYKNSKQSLEEYSIKTFSNLVITSLIYSVLSSGIMTVTSLFTFLILGNDNYDLIWRIELITLGIFYIPSVILSLTNTKDNLTKFIKVIVKYVLGILLITAFVIIYLYMLKILILRRLPSNQIFRILSALFIIGLPIWTMNEYFKKEKTIFQKINNKLPILFIPFIFLQIYSIAIRIYTRGFTVLRYLSVILIIVEVIYIILYIFNRKNISHIFIIINALIIVSVLMPGINMFWVSNKSQYNRIKEYINKDKLTNKEKDELYSAYEYLNSSKNGKKYIKKNISKEQQGQIKNKYDERYIYIDRELINGKLYNQEINVDGYKTINKFDNHKYSLNMKSNEAFKNIKINNNKFDLTNFMSLYIENNNNQDFNSYFNKNHELKVDDNMKIVLTSISISYQSDEDIIDYYEMKGYILQR
ncbi:MAG: DUF4153 domain-containing protein [Bacilli bacterium]|nr:DUF4153 domain-containing protein [Bacilli bacterium]